MDILSTWKNENESGEQVSKWEMVRLGDVCDVVSGYASNSKLFTTEDKGKPIIRIRDVLRGYSETNTTEDYHENYLIRKGDLLIGMDGEFNISPWNSGDALLNQRVCKIQSTSDNLENKYLLFFLPKVLKEIENATSFVTVKHLSSKTILDIQIPLPDKKVQQLITEVLEKTRKLIAKRKEQIAKLDLLVKSQFDTQYASNHFAA